MFDAVFEKAVDQRESQPNILIAHRAADIHRHEQPGGEVVAAAHVQKSITPAGLHPRQASPLRQHRAMEQAQHTAIIQPGLAIGQHPQPDPARQGSPVPIQFRVANPLINALAEQFVLVPLAGVFETYPWRPGVIVQRGGRCFSLPTLRLRREGGSLSLPTPRFPHRNRRRFRLAS